MPLSHFTKVYGVEDAKIKKITADPVGGTTTFATAIDVPGIKTVETAGEIAVKELRGDNQQLDANSTLQNVTATIHCAKKDLDILAVLLGGTVSDSGTTPNQIAEWVLTGATTLISPFQFEAKTPTAGADQVAGDNKLLLYKCVLSSFPTVGFAEEDYRTKTFGVQVVPRLSDGKRMSDAIRETSAALS